MRQGVPYLQPPASPKPVPPSSFFSTSLYVYRPNVLVILNMVLYQPEWVLTHSQHTRTRSVRHTQIPTCEDVSEKTNKLPYGTHDDHHCCCFTSLRPDLQQLLDISLLHR